jgi:hypothetical protein
MKRDMWFSTVQMYILKIRIRVSLKRRVARLMIVSALTRKHIRLPRMILWQVCYRTQYKRHIYHGTDPEKQFLSDGCSPCSRTYTDGYYNSNIPRAPKAERK